MTAVEDFTAAASEYLTMSNADFASKINSVILDCLTQSSVKFTLAKSLILTDSILTVNLNLILKHYSAASDNHHQDSV